MCKPKLTGEIMGDMVLAYIAEKPDKKTICPLVMILLDYYTGDQSEDELTMSEFMDNTFRKRSMLQDLIEKWRR